MAAFATIMQLRNAMKNVKFNKKFQENQPEDHQMVTEFDSNDKLDTVRFDTRHLNKNWEKSRILQIILGKHFQFSRIMVNRMNIMKKLETINAFLALFVLVTALFEYELAYFPKFYQFNTTTNTYFAEENPEKDYWGMPIRVIQSIVCIITVIISIISNRYRYLLLIDKRSISVEDPFWKTSIFSHLISDIFIDLIHPIPYLDMTFKIKQMSSSYTIRLQTFLYIFTFMKVYIILRTLASHTKYSGLESQKFCEEAGMEPSTVFALKALQKDEPMIVLIITLISVCCVLGIILRMIEMVGSSKGEGYKMFANGIWNIIVAMTTVGYGDFFPETHFGRVILILSVFIGTLIISLTVVNLNYMSSFNEEEERAYKILEHLSYRNELNHVSQRVINTHFQLYLLKKSKDRREIISSSVYSNMNYILKRQSQRRLEILRNIQDTFVTDVDKFQELNLILTQNLHDLRSNLASMAQIRLRLKKQRIHQIKLLQNIENSLKLTRDHIKPMIYKMIYKHNRQLANTNPLDSDEITRMIGVSAFKRKKDLKQEVVKQMEQLLFEFAKKTDVKNYYENLSLRCNHIQTREFLDKKQKLDRVIQKNRGNPTEENSNNNRTKTNPMTNMNEGNSKEKHVNETYNSKSQQSIRLDSQTSIEYQEKDPVYIQFEEFNKLNPRTKQIYFNISKQTFVLFNSLSELKMKNKKITQQNNKSNMLPENFENQEKEQILESLTYDIDLADEISKFDLNEYANDNQAGDSEKNQKAFYQRAFDDHSKSGISQDISNDTSLRFNNEPKLLLPREKETKNNRLISKNRDDSISKKSGKQNGNKNKVFKEIKYNEQSIEISNNKLDYSNFEEIKNESNMKLLKPIEMNKENNLNLSTLLNPKSNLNNHDNQKNYNFFGYVNNFNGDEDDNNNLESDFNNVEEGKIDFSRNINTSILATPNGKNASNNVNNFNNNKFLNNKAIQGSFPNKINKKFFEEAKNSYLGNEENNHATGIGFFNKNNENIRNNTLYLPDSPDIHKNHSNNRLMNHQNSNFNSYFGNNISIISNKESGINNNANEKSNLNISSNNLEKKNTSNNNVIKNKLTDNVAKGKNMKNFSNLLMNRKNNKDII